MHFVHFAVKRQINTLETYFNTSMQFFNRSARAYSVISSIHQRLDVLSNLLFYSVE